MKKSTLFFILLLINIKTPAQTTRYVTQNGKGNKDGSSWINASNDIQSMINESVSGDHVFVAIGTYNPNRTADTSTYSPGNRSNTFLMKNGVKLYGGFDPSNGIDDLTDTRITPSKSGTISGGTILKGINNVHHVVLGADVNDVNIDLDGFVITGAYSADLNQSPSYSGSLIVNGVTVYYVQGGGIAVSSLGNASVKLTNCSVDNNSAGNNGAAIFCRSNGSNNIKIINSNISSNSVSGYITGTGAISSSAVSNSTIDIINSNVSDNEISAAKGSGSPGISLSVENSISTINIINSIISNNRTLNSLNKSSFMIGANSKDTTIVNVIGSSIIGTHLPGNIWTIGIGGISLSAPNCIVNFQNSTVANLNGASYLAFSGQTNNHFKAYNTIIYNNKFNMVGNNIIKDIQYSLVQNENNTTSGNIDGTLAYPNLFTSLSTGDYTLPNVSPAKDKGSNNLYIANGGDISLDKDLANNPRVYDYANGGIIDMGAYENQSDTNINTVEVDDIDISIYPNPSRDNLNINSNQKIIGYEIYDLTGKKIIDYKKANIIKIDISQLPKNEYLIKLETQSNRKKTIKFIKN